MVAAALQYSHGIAPSRLTAQGFDARRPVESNETLAGLTRNRRVELMRDCTDQPR